MTTLEDIMIAEEILVTAGMIEADAEKLAPYFAQDKIEMQGEKEEWKVQYEEAKSYLAGTDDKFRLDIIDCGQEDVVGVQEDSFRIYAKCYMEEFSKPE